MKQGRPYTKNNRLSDVLALIQVLSLDKYTHRTEAGLTEELQGPPSSSQSWATLAKEHPEFFRVEKDDKKHLSLIARHVITRDDATGVKVLPSELVYPLLQTAIDLHDRQVSAAERWKSFMPLWTAIIAALITGLLLMASTHLTLRSARPVQTGRFVVSEGGASAKILLDTATGQLCLAAAGAKEPNQNLRPAATFTDTSVKDLWDRSGDIPLYPVTPCNQHSPPPSAILEPRFSPLFLRPVSFSPLSRLCS